MLLRSFSLPSSDELHRDSRAFGLSPSPLRGCVADLDLVLNCLSLSRSWALDLVRRLASLSSMAFEVGRALISLPSRAGLVDVVALFVLETPFGFGLRELLLTSTVELLLGLGLLELFLTAVSSSSGLRERRTRLSQGRWGDFSVLRGLDFPDFEVTLPSLVDLEGLLFLPRFSFELVATVPCSL